MIEFNIQGSPQTGVKNQTRLLFGMIRVSYDGVTSLQFYEMGIKTVVRNY
jgi:hypothetical protein